MSSAQRTPDPGQRIDIPAVPNLRDIGGYPTATGGRVRRGQLYRSTDLTHLQGADLERFADLGVRVVFDLRTADERAAEPDVVPEGTEVVVCDVLQDRTGAAPALVLQALGDPAAAERLFGDGRSAQLFEGGYREIVSLPSALGAYRAFFTTMAEDVSRPALFHCTTGKDRTGWAAAATLLLLGVSEADVFHDYELTNRDLLPALKPLFEQFRAAGGDPVLLEPVFGVQPAYLRSALDEMDQRFGSIESYFADGLGIGPDEQRRSREALVEP
ncbi:tyrosine-protein phosphatase [Promicromonospora sukumoe]|uniref:tyrosine-protein phosphatase n=1 Tax=Promicromonospora sukumoe TaxID=88382 RepID=UPI00036D390A|nr:tyrosine-protein phosphatase [Promicromonospora sukumoe]